MARDQTCVMTGAQSAQGLEACHIIPHAKGHQVRSERPWDHFKFLFMPST